MTSASRAVFAPIWKLPWPRGLVLISIALVVCDFLVAPPANADKFFDEDAVRTIGELLDSGKCSGGRECEVEFKEQRYWIRPVDLDDDGAAEYIVRPTRECGSGGCYTGLF